MFGEVPKPLNAKTSEMFKIGPKFKMGLSYYRYYRKISILQFSLIISSPVSYHVDKAYKVILGLISGSAWTKTTFDRMRKTRHVSCKVLAWLDTELDIWSWKLDYMERKLRFGFRKLSSIFQVRVICCDLLEYSFYSKLWKQDFSPLQYPQVKRTNRPDLQCVYGKMT